MATEFSQPAWDSESGQPYPGAEGAADAIAADQREVQVAAQAEVDKLRILARKRAEAEAESELESLTQIIGVKANQVGIRRTRWLWRDRVPTSGLSLFAGKGDVSKSTLFAEMIAWLTTGNMKGEYYGAPQTVGYIVNEDSLAETVVPRLVAAGADLDKVLFLRSLSPFGEDAIMLPRDVERLRKFITENQLVALFIDPLSANVSGKKNDQGDMRATFQRVNTLSEETRAAIIGLAHTRKAGAADVIEAVMGSSEQTNVARSVHGLVMDPEEDNARILSCEKLNVGQKHKLASLRFRVNSVWVQCTDGTDEVTSMPKIEWLEEITETASDMMEDKLYGNAGVGDCANWLLQLIANNGGQMYSSDIREEAKRKKFSPAMLDRSRRKVGVISKRIKEPGGRSMWYHPSNTPHG